MARRYVDIGINLSDNVFRGVYHGKQRHADDLDHVVSRARGIGVQKMLVTGSDVAESARAVDVARAYPGLCYATVGIHPCSARALADHPHGTDALIADLRKLAQQARDDGTAKAFGEIGLDYDRLPLCDAGTQRDAFARQLDLAVDLGMPLFLHSRAAADDFERILRPRLTRLPQGGVVHSFTGTSDEMHRILDMGLDLGVNGCSLKTDENVAVVREIPIDRLHIETDGPWCEMRPSHASAAFLQDAPRNPPSVKKESWRADRMVKGRNEPCTISRVAWAVAKIKAVDVDELCERVWSNSTRMFDLG
ncbi:Mg-dependent DNase [Piedraia hortae CBS 480.64]|uniref:Mg-dependent DNase n=1 Tax=Piedraia hortae CBS 480.64 TaxID=1314780 RepID=A0A6A7CAU5_9PEZI|nr:Mg-dependent DNase [Piedraia hortae CBS 480.64]